MVQTFDNFMNEGLTKGLKGYTMNDFIERMKSMNSNDRNNLLDTLLSKYPELSDDIISKIDIKKTDNVKDKQALLRLILDKYPEKFEEIAKKIRTDDEEFRDTYFNLYVFLEYDDYKEVVIDGEKYHKKQFAFEKMVKINIYDKNSLNNMSGMKLRSRFQQGTTIYGVFIPIDLLDDNSYSNGDLNEYEIEYVNKNKFKL